MWITSNGNVLVVILKSFLIVVKLAMKLFILFPDTGEMNLKQPQELFCIKEDVLKTLETFTGRKPMLGPFLDKVADLSLFLRCFSVNFIKC